MCLCLFVCMWGGVFTDYNLFMRNSLLCIYLFFGTRKQTHMHAELMCEIWTNVYFFFFCLWWYVILYLFQMNWVIIFFLVYINQHCERQKEYSLNKESEPFIFRDTFFFSGKVGSPISLLVVLWWPFDGFIPRGEIVCDTPILFVLTVN